MNATENVKKCFALYCKLDEREVEYLNAMICAKGMLSGVVAEPEEKRRVGRPKGSKNNPKEPSAAGRAMGSWMDGAEAAQNTSTECFVTSQQQANLGDGLYTQDNGSRFVSGEEK